METPFKYRIYYDDGTTYSGPIELAPCEGVIIVVQTDPDVGREMLHAKDFYYWEYGRWWGADRWGMEDYLRRPGWRKIVAGRNTNYSNYSQIYDKAYTVLDFPIKTARLLTEEPKR